MNRKILVLDPTMKFLKTIQKLQTRGMIPIVVKKGDDVIYSTIYRKTADGYYRQSWIKTRHVTRKKEVL